MIRQRFHGRRWAASPIRTLALSVGIGAAGLASLPVEAQMAVRGEVIYTMDGTPLQDGVIVITDGRIAAVGSASEIEIPEDCRVLEAKVVTPGLIDAHGTVGLTGILNIDHDQDQLERSAPIQPELRAIDAYNAHEELVEYVRSFGITTVHTGHAPGELISGQTMIVKTVGNTVEEAAIVKTAAVAATLGPDALRRGGSPGTRGKMMAMLRQELIKTQAYLARRDAEGDEGDEGDAEGDTADDIATDEPAEEDGDEQGSGRPGARNLRMETLGRVLDGELPLIVTAHRAQDIASALRLVEEFGIRLWLDGAAEAYLLLDEIKAAGVPVIIHPTMQRASGELENLSFETAAKLREAGVPIAMQSGYEDYVPKTRIVLFEAAIAAANGLSFEEALATITCDAAEILGIADRVGSIAVGMDGDIALFDGDPFEYTSHCVGVVINGEIVSEEKR